MDGHPHLLDQQDDMEHLATYIAAAPSNRAPVLHTGPAATKPGTHNPSAQPGQNSGASSPPALTPGSALVKTSFANHPSAQQKPFRQDHAASRQDGHSISSHQSRQRYRSRRGSVLQDHAPSSHVSEQGTRQHYDELSQQLSDLSLHDCQQPVGDRAHRHRSSFVEACSTVRHAEQGDGRSPRCGQSQYSNFVDVLSSSRKAHQPETTTDVGFDLHADQTSSCEWEDEDDEHQYEEVTVNRAKTASNGNEPEIPTTQDLKYTSLVWAESSAKMMYLCGRKMYEVMWTSQTSQRLRRSALHTTRNASGQAANSLGRLVMNTCKGSLGGVKHYVSRRCSVLRAQRRSPREAVRLSALRILRLSRIKLAGVAAQVPKIRDEEPEEDAEENWDLCDSVEQDQPSNVSVSSTNDYGDEGLDLPGLYEDNIYDD